MSAGASRTGKRWTAREEDELRLSWGHHSLDEIADRLHRTPEGVYKRAGDLDLGLGCPQGFEYLFHAARRTGFCHETIQLICQTYNVKVRHAMAHPKFGGRQRYVEPCAIDAAIAKWCRSESIEEAARRTGIDRSTLRVWLTQDAAAGLVTMKVRRKWSRYRIDPSVIDAVVARRRVGESFAEAARRVGISKHTLRAWLLEANVERPPTDRWRVDPAVVDRVVAARAAASKHPSVRTRVAAHIPLSAASAQPADESSPQLKLAV